MQLIDYPIIPKGFCAVYSVNERTLQPTGQFYAQKNTVMTGAVQCMSRICGWDDRYKPAYMYIEFENVPNPGDPPVVPTYTKYDDISYFINLQYSSTKDFIRAPILVQPGFTASSSSFTDNVVTFFAMTSSTLTGVWGKPFNAANNSAVYGGALVAAPYPLSQSSDIVFARNYPAGANVTKEDGEQISIQWSIEFTV